MSDFKERIARLSPEKRAALEQMLLHKRSETPAAKPIPRRQHTGPLPLSFAQQRLWFLDQLTSGAPIYNAALGLSLTGALDAAALRKSFDSIVERHEILRTTYHLEDDGNPVQRIQPACSAGTKYLDILKLPEHKRRQGIAQVLREECRRPFDLSKDLLLRTVLLRVAENEHILLIVSHHIACDGWTVAVLFQELQRWYAFHTTGAPTMLPELPIQYADFAVWQREPAQVEAMEGQTGYWKRQLAGSPPHITLPLDHPRPQHQAFSGAHYFFDLPAETAAGLAAVSREENTTQYIVCLAAFGVLMSALSGQDDILVGTPIANRGRLEIEPLIGYFANTLVMRLRVPGTAGFRAVLRGIREAALEAYANQDTPFEKVVEELRLPRDPSRNPLFQVNFRVRSTAGPQLTLPGIASRPVEVDAGSSKFDLALDVCTHPQAGRSFFEYNTALFDVATVERICAEFILLANELTASRETPITELESFVRIRESLARSTSRSVPKISRMRRPVELASPQFSATGERNS